MPLTPSQVDELLVYARNLWSHTFELPTDKTSLAVKRRVWLDVLGDLDQGLLQRTMIEMAYQHFAPQPGELRQAALKRVRIEAGDVRTPDWDQALAEMVRLIKRWGWPNGVEAMSDAERFSPLLPEVINRFGGGWELTCKEVTDPPSTTYRAQFRDAWKLATGREEIDRYRPAPALIAAVDECFPELEA